MNGQESVVVTERDGFAVLTLNRPDKLNSFDEEMALALQSALKESGQKKSIRALLLTGTGRAFSAGQDLSICRPHGSEAEPVWPELGSIVRRFYNPVVQLIREIPKPVVASVNGVAAGAGANIALSCDIVLCAENASFIQSFSRVGLIPDSGGSFILPRLLGFGRASAICHLAEKVSAQQALEWGLVYKVFPDAELSSEAERVCKDLALQPTAVIALTKKAFNDALFPDLRRSLEQEAELQSAAGRTSDFREGVKAFLEKRKPNFIGE